MTENTYPENSSIRRRGKKEKCNLSNLENTNQDFALYLREDILNLQTELSDSSVLFDPFVLASKLQQCIRTQDYEPVQTTNDKYGNKRGVDGFLETTSKKSTSSIVSFAKKYVTDTVAYFYPPSPVLLAYCHYKSTGYPWIVGSIKYNKSSYITILSLRWLEFSTINLGSDRDIDILSPSSVINDETIDPSIDPSVSRRDIFNKTLGGGESQKSKRWPLTFIDPYPQWRLLTISQESLVVAIGYSNGAVEIIAACETDEDKAGEIEDGSIRKRIFIPPPPRDVDFSPIIALHFVDANHLLVCRVTGHMEVWKLFPGQCQFPARLINRSHFNAQVKRWTNILPFSGFLEPIFSAEYHHDTNTLVLAGEHQENLHDGLHTFHVATKTPFFTPIKRSFLAGQRKQKFKKLLRDTWRGSQNDGFVSLCISGDGLLAAIHCSRSISIWSFPECNLLTNIISYSVPLNGVSLKSSIASSSSHESAPLRINWWRRSLAPDENAKKNVLTQNLLAVIKNDGKLSVIDVTTMENQLLSNSCDDGNVKECVNFKPFASFAIKQCLSEPSAELTVLNCSLHVQRHSQIPITQSKSAVPILDTIFSVLGLPTDAKEHLEPSNSDAAEVTTPMSVDIVRIASTTPEELFLHRIRSGHFAEAASLAKEHGLDEEIVCQNQWLALFHQEHAPLFTNVQEFIRLVQVTLTGIKHRPNWVLSECLHRIPPFSNSWKPTDLFQAVKAILNFGLSKSSGDLETRFKTRLQHIEILTDIFAEECAIASASLNPILRSTQDWAKELQAFRHTSVIDLCLFYLHSYRYSAFSIFSKYYPSEVLPNLLALISTLPPTESPSDYLDLAFVSLLPYASQTDAQPDKDNAVGKLFDCLPSQFRQFRDLQPMTIAAWTYARIFELDSQTGLTTEAMELVNGIIRILSTSYMSSLLHLRKAIKQLERIKFELKQFSVFLYRSTQGMACSNALRRNLYYDDIERKENKVQLSTIKLSTFVHLPYDQRISLLINLSIPSPNASGSVVFQTIVSHLLPFILMINPARKSPLNIETHVSKCLGQVVTVVGVEKSLLFLVKEWARSGPESHLKTTFKGINFEQCILLTSTNYQPADFMSFIQDVLNILTYIEDTKIPIGGCAGWWVEVDAIQKLRLRLKSIVSALLNFYAAVGQRNLQMPPFSFTSLAEIVSLKVEGEKNNGILLKLATAWVSCLRHFTENLRSNNISQSMFARGRQLVANTSSTPQTNLEALQNKADDRGQFKEFFDTMCICFEELIGNNGMYEARRYLWTGILCSGDRQLIDFVGDSLSDSPVAADCLAFATRSYFDATAAFGIGDSNEALGVACLELWRSNRQSADNPEDMFTLEHKFYRAMAFLKQPVNSKEMYKLWSTCSHERRNLFISALEQYFPTNLFADRKALIIEGGYFGLSEVGTLRCIILVVFRMCSSSSISVYLEPIEQAFACLQDVLMKRSTEAWPEVALWASGDDSYLETDYTGIESFANYRVLYQLFPQSANNSQQVDYDVERFRLTLSRFVVAYSETATFWQRSRLTSLLAMTISRLDSCLPKRKQSSVAQKLLDAFRTVPVDIVEEKPRYPQCDLYLSPLDEENKLANLECTTSVTPLSPLMGTFLDNWAGVPISNSNLKTALLETCFLDAKAYLDVGLIHAYGPPAEFAEKHWVRELGARLSNQDDCFRLLALSVAASKYTPTRQNPLPPVQTLLESLERLCAKHGAVRSWRSAYIVSSVKDSSLSAALLLSSHLPTAESRASLVLSHLTDILFKPTLYGDIKDQLKEISCHLKREVSPDEMTTFLDKVVSTRFHELGLSTVALLLKVFLAVLGKETDALLDGLPIITHISLLKPTPNIDTRIYQAIVKAVAISSDDTNLLNFIESQLTSIQVVEATAAFVKCLKTCLGVQRLDMSEAVLYEIYATRLMKPPFADLNGCAECFRTILTAGGVEHLFGWMKRNLFGQASRTVGLWERTQLLDGAVSDTTNHLKLQGPRSEETDFLQRLQHYRSHLHKLQSSGSSFFSDHLLSGDLVDCFLAHDPEEEMEGHQLMLRFVQEILQAEEKIEFSDIAIDTFLINVEASTNLLSFTASEPTYLEAFVECVNEFVTFRLHDWLLLNESGWKVVGSWADSLSRHISPLTLSSAIPLLLSWSRLQLLFGKRLLACLAPSHSPTDTIKAAYRHALRRAIPDSDHICVEDPIDALVDFLRKGGSSESVLDSLLTGFSKLGESEGANLVQVVSIAIELVTLMLADSPSEDFHSPEEVSMWESWLARFTSNPLLMKLCCGQLLSRVFFKKQAAAYATACLNHLLQLTSSSEPGANVLRATLLSIIVGWGSPEEVDTALKWSDATVEIWHQIDLIACRRFVSRYGLKWIDLATSNTALFSRALTAVMETASLSSSKLLVDCFERRSLRLLVEAELWIDATALCNSISGSSSSSSEQAQPRMHNLIQHIHRLLF